MEAPQFPVGPVKVEEALNKAQRDDLIAQIEEAPALLRKAVKDLSLSQLDTVYKNWSLRQIVNHLTDSHVNSYVRFKWTLTEDKPTIKAYDENRWSALEEARTGDVEPSLVLMEGIHARWARLLRTMTDEEFSRSFIHPDGRTIGLTRALQIYAWHGRHHTGQILWLKDNRLK
jgi:uncharacterized damage-inducible protein DinB